MGSRRCVQRGMSLVELMIALVIGLILLLGVVQALVMSRSAVVSQQSMATVAESARVVFEMMNRELRQTGLNASGADWISFEEVDAAPYGATWLLSAEADGSTLRYWVNEDNELMVRRDTDSAQALVDGINGIDLLFGIGDSSSGDVQYVDRTALSAADPEDIWALRLSLTLADPEDTGSELFMGERTLSHTIALRNPILNAIAEASGTGADDAGDDDEQDSADSGVTDGDDSQTESDQGELTDTGDDEAGDEEGDETEESDAGAVVDSAVASCDVTVSGKTSSKNSSVAISNLDSGDSLGSCSSGTNKKYECSLGSVNEGVTLKIAEGGSSLTRSLDCSDDAVTFTVNF